MISPESDEGTSSKLAGMNSPDSNAALHGELLHLKSRRWALIALLACLITLPCVLFMRPLWAQLVTLGSGSFMIAAGLWGLVLAGGPLLFLVAGLTALFLRVEARFAPRSQPRPIGDALVIALALILSFTPALAALYPPIKAVMSGLISFRGPGRVYSLATDPYGFWQGVAFWLMGAATLALLAGFYWRSRWLKHKASASTATSVAEPEQLSA